MARVERFEDLVAWQKARTLTRSIYETTRALPMSGDRPFVGQVRRAAVSVMANLAEGFERGSRGEFHQFLSMAKASCAELRSHLYIALDVGYLNRDTFDRLQTDAEEVGRIVGGLRAAVARQRAETRRT